MYKFSANGLEDKLKYAKPFSFFETVREKFKKANLEENFLSSKNLEESAVDSEVSKETKEFKKKAKMTKEIYENNLAYMSKLYSKINKSNKRIEKKKEFLTENFNKNVFEEKMKKDLVYFKHILENILPQGENKVYQELYETAFDLTKDALLKTIELYEETNVKPRYLSPALNAKEIEESKIVDLYNTNFKKFLTENYIIPLRKGNFEELNESEDIKKFTKYLIENDIEENIDNIIAYLPFEKRVTEFLESVLIPEPARNRINYFIESQDLSYFDIFEKNAQTINESLEDAIEKISSLISPFLFKNSIQTDKDKEDGKDEMNPIKYAGVSMVCKKINDGPMECTVGDSDDSNDSEEAEKDTDELVKEVEKIADEDSAAMDEMKDDIEADAIMPDEDKDGDADVEIDIDEEDDDKDHDGKPDSEEDHGELPEDFKGDHKDAEKSKDKEDKEDKEDKDSDEDKKDLKESTVVEETEEEPGAAKTIPYDKKKALKEADKEEIVPDEADEQTTLGDDVKEEK